jgi:hypothetical protein
VELGILVGVLDLVTATLHVFISFETLIHQVLEAPGLN